MRKAGYPVRDLKSSADIEEWNRMYKEKYGHDHIVKRELKWPYWC
jgi:hypothetical protein